MPETEKGKALIVDDHEVVRDGVALAFQSRNDFDEPLQAGTTREALEVIHREVPNLVVADLALPDRSGMELIRDALATFPQIKFLIFSMHDEGLYAERALRAGAKGYLMKDSSAQELRNAIDRVANGEVYVSSKLGSILLQRLSGKKEVDGRNSVLQVLSDRELQIFEMVGQAMSNQVIADKLNITPRTVDAHKTRIKSKLQISDNNALLRFAVRWLDDATICGDFGENRE